jgi:hypothetical protein
LIPQSAGSVHRLARLEREYVQVHSARWGIGRFLFSFSSYAGVAKVAAMSIRVISIVCVLALLSFVAGAEAPAQSDARQFISWLLEDDREISGVPFPEIVEATSGKKVLPLDRSSEIDRDLLEKIGAGLDEVLRRMNATNSAAQQQRRINEVSGHFENEIQKVLNEIPGFVCEIPKNAAGRVQRSGYPDLRLADEKSRRVLYIDPKLYEEKNRNSSLRTFYFEPKRETNKILDDAHHLIVGIAHDGKKNGEHWQFLSWELVDLAHFRVRLKAEFQGSNRDLYRSEAVVRRSGD